MKKFGLLISIIFLWFSASATNVLSISSHQGHPGDTVEVHVSLSNTDAVVALQTDISIGTSLNYIEGSCVLSSRSNGHTISASVVSGALKIIVYSLSLNAFNGSTGELLSFKVILGNNPITQPLSLSNTTLSNANGTALPVSSTTGNILILTPKLQFYSGNTVDFGREPILQTYTRTISIRNIGTDVLTIDSLSFSASELSCSNTFPLSINPSVIQTLTINYAPTRAGSINERITIHSNNIVDNPFAPTPYVTVTAEPYTVNRIDLESASGHSDSIVTIHVSLSNMDSISGFQMNFKLPSALEYVNNSFQLSNRSTDHLATSGMTGDTLTLIAYSPNNASFTGNQGRICSFQLKLVGQSGTYYLNNFNNIVSNIHGNNVLSNFNSTSVNIQSPQIDCSNNMSMGRSKVTETSTKTFFISNYGQAPLIIDTINFSLPDFSISDILPITIRAWRTVSIHVVHNGQQEGTITTTMQIHSNDPNLRYKNVTVSIERFEPNGFNLSTNAHFNTENVQLAVNLDNYSDITAAQFDIQLPEGYSAQSSDFQLTSRSNSHSVSSFQLDSNKWRIIMFSLNNTLFSGHNGAILTVNMHPSEGLSAGQFSVSMENIIISDLAGNNRNTESNPNITFTTTTPQYTVSVNQTEGGVVSGNIGTFAGNTSITLTATPDACHIFEHWQDGNNENPRTFTLTQDTLFTPFYQTRIYTSEFAQDACDSFNWNGISYTQTGSYTQTLQSAHGCDSVVTLHLTINHSTSGDTTAVACESFTWNGISYTQTGTYVQTLQNALGCDSVVTLHLTINNSTSSDTSAVACESFTWHGIEYTETPTVAPTYTLTNSLGCDSVITLHLTINHSTSGDTTVVACESFTWHGIEYTETPTVAPTYTLTNPLGCDSVVTLHLTIGHSVTVQLTDTVGEGQAYNDNGFYFPADSTMYPHVIVKTQCTPSLQTGCDSCTTLTLMVIHIDTNMLSGTAQADQVEQDVVVFISMDNESNITAVQFDIQIPDSYNVQASDFVKGSRCSNHTLSTSNIGNNSWRVMIFSMQNQLFAGDSGIVATITLHPQSTTQVGDYNLELSNALLSNIQGQNCLTSFQQSISFTTNCTGAETSDIRSICQNELPYEWNGYTFEEAGTHIENLSTIHGCDSIVTMILNVKATSASIDSVVAEDSYTWIDGNTYYESTNTPTVTLTNALGCDSVITLHLTITVGIKDIDTKHITIYPNPTSGIVNIENDSNIETINIYNIYGQSVRQVSVGCNNCALNMSDLAAGTYILHIILESNNGRDGVHNNSTDIYKRIIMK